MDHLSDKFYRYGPGITIFALGIIGWFWAASYYPKHLFPNPLETLDAFWGLVTHGKFMAPFLDTMAHMLVAFVISGVLGVLLGVLMGRIAFFERFFEGLVPIVQTIPRIITITLAIVLLNLTFSGVVFVGVLSAVPFTIVGVWQAARGVDKGLIEMARSYGYKTPTIVRRIVIPWVMPDIFSALRITLGMLWHAILVAEFIMGVQGMGREMSTAMSLYDIPTIFAWGVVVIITMYALEALFFRLWERRVLAWRS